MLNAQWRELCQKNIEIQAACADLQNHIDQIKLEAKERYDEPFLNNAICPASLDVSD